MRMWKRLRHRRQLKRWRELRVVAERARKLDAMGARETARFLREQARGIYP